MGRVGVFYQTLFPFGAFGPRGWSASGHKRAMDWLKKLGYTSVVFGSFPVFKNEPDDWTMLEEVHLYHSGLGGRPSYETGLVYSPQDKYLSDEATRRRSDDLRAAAEYAQSIGLEAFLWVLPSIGGVQFAREHPECLATGHSDFWVEGLTLCISNSEARAYLASFWREQLARYSFVDGLMILPRDPGGCRCARCQPQSRMLCDGVNMIAGLAREVNPTAQIGFMSWHVANDEVPVLAAGLPSGVFICEAPRIHGADISLDHYEGRLELWQQAGRRVETWVEIQENPTTLLPSAYPKRIERIARIAERRGCDGTWATSTQNPYLFPLHFGIFPKVMAHPQTDSYQWVDEYLELAFGAPAVHLGREWVRLNEETWDLLQAPSQYHAGFIWPFVTFWGHRMLPVQSVQKGLSDRAKSDLIRARDTAARAYEAAQALAAEIMGYNAVEGNMIATSAEVVALRAAMRAAKIPVIDALHEGDARTALSYWKHVIDLCEQMVAAAHNAPNTEILLHHWRKLALWPDRLRVLGEQFTELAETKSYASISPGLTMVDKFPSALPVEPDPEARAG